MQRDEEGRKKLTQWTRYLTVVLCLFQAYGYGLFTEQIPGAVATPGFFFRLTTVLTLTTGGVFVMWLGEQRSEEHTSELQSQSNLVCRLLLEKKKKKQSTT